MKKTLILVVDRDDDFGFKAGVSSPVVGYKECIKAATALGIADPEDSDTNALFAALNICKEMANDPDSGDFEVALICGNQKVGYKSDTVLVDQLELVLELVNPDRAILVGDGAEDEYIYPIITSRVHVDSVRKVYVKQAPGVEGTFYIFKRIFEDPQKKRRFLGPLCWIFILLSMIYIVTNMFVSSSIVDFVGRSTSPLVLFLFGVLIAFYAYDIEERVAGFFDNIRKSAKGGSLSFVFVVASVGLVITGFFVGILSVNNVYTERDLQVILIFLAYSTWFFIFAFMMYMFGTILDGYINSRTIKYRYVTLILNLVSVGLIISGILDYLLDYASLYASGQNLFFFEILAGFVFAIISSILRLRVNEMYGPATADAEDTPNEVH
ncbi:MAG: DUF373 family protein [archaeon]|nr:DUF373 family protein [archaeon]